MSNNTSSAFDRVDAIADELLIYLEMLDDLIPYSREEQGRAQLEGLRSMLGYLSKTHAIMKAQRARGRQETRWGSKALQARRLEAAHQ